MSRKTISAGILLKSNNKFLIAHPTEGTGTTHKWGIPKGKQDGNEDLSTTALREFYEETGLNLTPLLSDGSVSMSHEPITTFNVGNDKKVYVFFAQDHLGILADYPFKCLVNVDDKFPEIDDYQWIEAPDALDTVSDSQIKLFSYAIKYKL